MAQDTLNGTQAPSGRGKAKEILCDAASIQAYKDGSKNVQISVSAHPAMYAAIVESLARDEKNVESTEGKTMLTRNAYSNALRHALANSFEYSGVLMIPSGRGTAGLVAVFKTTVQSMFELARSIGQLANMNEDQVKSLAFAKAKDSVTSHPQLNGVDIDDDLLEALWNGGDIEIGDDDDDDDDAVDPSTVAATPAQPFS